MHEWLERARDRLVATTGDEAACFELSQADTDDLLELARVAAHESGERTNAPLAAYLAGLARGRHPERDLRALVDDLIGTS
jgi:ribosomal 50S subunit-associated protein YjgA (DUF615 family)